jgi:1-acyl-sn-glycerol-3-phosphate acyltransferase
MKAVHGIKIVGKENIKKNKELIKEGIITICNHVFMWDFIGIMMAMRPRLSYYPAWSTNFEGPNAGVIDLTGGIPIPTKNLKSVKKFNDALNQVLIDKKILHFYPEASMWYYYPDIRPFKQTVFKLAVKHNKPIIPMGYSFREPKGLYKIYKRRPCVTLNIGEPIYPNESLNIPERINDLQHRCYVKVQELVGIKPGDPTYNENQDIETYKKTM